MYPMHARVSPAKTVKSVMKVLVSPIHAKMCNVCKATSADLASVPAILVKQYVAAKVCNVLQENVWIYAKTKPVHKDKFAKQETVWSTTVITSRVIREKSVKKANVPTIHAKEKLALTTHIAAKVNVSTPVSGFLAKQEKLVKKVPVCAMLAPVNNVRQDKSAKTDNVLKIVAIRFLAKKAKFVTLLPVYARTILV